MSAIWALFLVSLLASSSYAAGRLHGQLSYKIGFRSGYRQGFGDGDRAAWLLGRRESGPAHRRNGPPPTLSSSPAPLAAPPVGQPSGPHAARTSGQRARVAGPPAATAVIEPPAPVVTAPMSGLAAAAIAARQLVIPLPEDDVPGPAASPAHSTPDEDSVPAAIPVAAESGSGHLAGPPVPAIPGPGPAGHRRELGAGPAGPGHLPNGGMPLGLSPAGPQNVRPIRGVVRQGTMYHATAQVAVRGGRHAHPD